MKFIKNNGTFISPFYGLKLSSDETHSLVSYHDFGTFEQILNRKKILVRIDSTVKIGMGHVFNMLTILNHFRNDEILILMHKNKNLGGLFLSWEIVFSSCWYANKKEQYIYPFSRARPSKRQ